MSERRGALLDGFPTQFLTRRELNRVKLDTSDAHEGLMAAAAKVLTAFW